MFRLIDIVFFSINWKNYFDRSILVISMTVLMDTEGRSKQKLRCEVHPLQQASALPGD